MLRAATLLTLLLTPTLASAQSLAERFEAAVKKARPAAITDLEKRLEDRKSLVEAAKRGPINQPKNDYNSSTAPDGHTLHNFYFRTAADRRDITARYQKQLADATRDLKDLKADTAWPCVNKSLREVEVGEFICLAGEYKIALKESDDAAWIEKTNASSPECFLLTGADLSRYADDKPIDFIDAKADLIFEVKGTRPAPESLRLSPAAGKTLYELEMHSAEQLTKQLPAGVRILKLGAPLAADLEKDLPTPEVLKK